MRRAIALAIVLALAYLVRDAGGELLGPRSIGLALGFALIAAALAGDVADRIKLPRVTGYLLFGLLCGPYLANIISRPMARELQIFNGLAVALIALIAGLEMNFHRLRPELPAMLRVGGVTIAVMNGSFFLLLWLTWPWLPVYPEATGLLRIALAGLLATIVSCSSPSVAIAIITESRAAGLLSRLVVAVVILADLALILLFTLAIQLVRAALGATPEAEVALLARLSWQIFGSFAFGALVGAAFGLYLVYVNREIAIVLIATCALLSVVGHGLHFEPVLAALMAGLVVENIARSRADVLREAVEQSALPVLVVFFAVAGASLQLDALATVGLLVIIPLSAARMGLQRLGTGLGARLAGIQPPVDRLVWTGLVSQAGVTLGLTLIVAREFPDWGVRLEVLVVSLIALHQLVGPLLFRAALARAGEIGRADTPAPTPAAS